MTTIHTRSEWGGPDFAGTPSVPDSSRTEFFVHYEGGSATTDSGAKAMQSINAGHLANGWAGVGYNFVVMLDGSIWEGRGWTLVGAHCPNHNRSGWGVQVHIGGDQQPTPEALAAVDDLYDEACARAGRRLAKRGHKDGYATECPGVPLYAWVRAGMPRPQTTAPAPAAEATEEDDMDRTLLVKCLDPMAVYEAVTTSQGVRLAYVGSNDEVAQEIGLKARMVEFATEADMLADFTLSKGRIVV